MRIVLIIVVVLVVLVGGGLCAVTRGMKEIKNLSIGNPDVARSIERSDLLMGTVVGQRIYGGSLIRSRRIAAKVAREINRLEKLWSVFRAGSEINRISGAAGEAPVRVHCDTLRVLQRAKELGRECGGRFDITAAPLTELWREAAERGRPPGKESVADRLGLVDFDSLELDDRGYARLARKGQCLDLGGIGKGYAADRAKEIYRRLGVKGGLINLGGNVMAVGARPDGSPWRVGVRYPDINRAALAGYIMVRDAAVVSSGGYEQFFEYNGTCYQHIIDPSTGESATTDVLGATVVAPAAADADAYATAVCVMGVKGGLEFLEKLPDVEGLIFDKDKHLYLTPGLEDRFFRLEV